MNFVLIAEVCPVGCIIKASFKGKNNLEKYEEDSQEA